MIKDFMFLLYLFIRDLINEMIAILTELLIKLGLDEDNPGDLVLNNIKELTIDDDKVIEAAITLYKDLL